MDFKSSRLPSTLKELEWYWDKCVNNNMDFSNIIIDGNIIDFTIPIDYFNLSDVVADKLSFIGRKFDFFSQPNALKEFQFNIFGDINADTHIGVLLSNINHFRKDASAYGIYAAFNFCNKSVYCAFTICLVDKDTGVEMETAVIEISQDEETYIQPIFINQEALDYFGYDDIAKFSYWLANFWVGVQYEMNNHPEEIRTVEQRGITFNSLEKHRESNHIVLVKRTILVEEGENKSIHGSSDTERQYSAKVWGVRGHYRSLQNGSVIYVNPYFKGKERLESKPYYEKEYKFDSDTNKLDEF